MNNDGETKKGFSGLSGLASDVGDTIKAEQSKLKSGAGEEKVNKASGSGHASNQTRTVEPTKKVEVSTSDERSGHKKYFIIVAVIALLLWIVTQSNNRNTTSPKPLPKSSSQPVPDSRPTSVPTQLSYTKPSVGTNNILNVSEIRWCIREGIRIDAMRNVFSSNSGIDKFNSLVNDYNSRCGSYRYRSGSQTRAERDVAPHKLEIQEEAKREARTYENELNAPDLRAVTTNSTHTLSGPNPKLTQQYDPDLIRQIQTLLAGFGYEIDRVDGLFGKTTQAAIKSFQQAAEHTVDGIPDRELLEILEYVKSELVKKRPGGFDEPVQSPSSKIPANAWVSGSNWFCNDGYRKVSNRCEKLSVPENAWVSGSSWFCNDGYRKVSNRCEKLSVPENAWVSGSSWFCNDGYRKVSNRCEKLSVPENAWVS
ncbi:peptidoglycan-binding domain-containing protein, partial [Alteromonas macleodii]|uniref:peptidoglycan-binding domain-containing protein n=1 Tax=Alteromonas macleodii TaxID=28108 RepID=UPI003008D4F1